VTFDEKMKRFWTDRIAIVTALVGIGLMALTIIWRINPAEGSVVPDFLTGNPVGVGAICVLLVTCMPAWILAVTLCMLLPLPERMQYSLACAAMLVMQGIAYFMIGKLISLCVRKICRRKESSNTASHGTALPRRP
jgi:hypothetical protein